MSQKRQRKKGEQGTDDSWLLPYADMLTLLLALFIVLFAMSEVDVKRFEQLAYIFETEFVGGAGIVEDGLTLVPEDDPAHDLENDDKEDEKSDEEKEKLVEQELEQLEMMKSNIDAYILEHNLSDVLHTELSGEGLLITMRTDITFDSGSATVKTGARDIAKEIATLIKTDPLHEIVISGHADDVPVHNAEFASNWELSAMRAIQFMYLLIDDSEIDPKWFSSKGYGEYQPLLPNTSEENRAVNRRVEVLIEPNFNIEEEFEDKDEQ